MLNNIYFDIDETLIHTITGKLPEQDHVYHMIEDGDYYTIIRPCAKRLIEFARDLVGKDRVYILTTSVTEYARNVNRLAEFGFEHDHILTREDMAAATQPDPDTYVYQTAPHPSAHPDNVLIDNLPPRYNANKTDYIGITGQLDKYLHIRDYYGVNFAEDGFEEDVRKFLHGRASATNVED